MKEIQEQILREVRSSKVKGVVIDLSGVRIVEPYLASIIDNTAKMVHLLGAETVLTGIKPGVAISLVNLNFDFKEIYGTARTFEEGVEKLQPIVGEGELDLERVEETIGRGETLNVLQEEEDKEKKNLIND